MGRTAQKALFPFEGASALADGGNACEVVSVGKRRDGGTRFWCLTHKADATAKYGKPALKCRAAHVPSIGPSEELRLDLDQYPGGVALWGAVPAVYDTTRLPMDRGIHVHARPAIGGEKEIDCTVRAVRILGKNLPTDGISISELDAIYFMVSSVAGHPMRHVTCTYCGYGHLDRDWFSTHPHRRHLCAGCGRHFWDKEIAIGNPICGVREICGYSVHRTMAAKEKLTIKQADYPGGVQIWGSNPALIWTSHLSEAEGIHVHAFVSEGAMPALDETYARVTIDGVSLDPMMVRTLMAQEALPSIRDRVQPIDCPSCAEPRFATGEGAFNATMHHLCEKCGTQFTTRGRLRKTIPNPLPRVLSDLAKEAVRTPQKHRLDLLPETL